MFQNTNWLDSDTLSEQAMREEWSNEFEVLETKNRDVPSPNLLSISI